MASVCPYITKKRQPLPCAISANSRTSEKISRFVEHYNYARPHSALHALTPSDQYFNVTEAVKKYLSDCQAPKNNAEEALDTIGVARKSKIYLIGKVLGQDVRIQEVGGQLSIHLNNQLWRDICLVQ